MLFLEQGCMLQRYGSKRSFAIRSVGPSSPQGWWTHRSLGSAPPVSGEVWMGARGFKCKLERHNLSFIGRGGEKYRTFPNIQTPWEWEVQGSRYGMNESWEWA